MNASLLFDYIERISHLFRSEVRLQGMDFDLHPIQLNAMYYLTRSNRYSNTPQGVTEYFGLTKGTVSQTLKALDGKGLIRKTRDKKDGRVIHLDVTAKGKKLLDKVLKGNMIQQTAEGLSEVSTAQLIENLQELLRSMQELNGMKPFGVCNNCRFNKTLEGGQFLCELTQEKLSPKDTTLLCIEYQSPEDEGETVHSVSS